MGTREAPVSGRPIDLADGYVCSFLRYSFKGDCWSFSRLLFRIHWRFWVEVLPTRNRRRTTWFVFSNPFQTVRRFHTPADEKERGHLTMPSRERAFSSNPGETSQQQPGLGLWLGRTYVVKHESATNLQTLLQGKLHNGLLL